MNQDEKPKIIHQQWQQPRGWLERTLEKIEDFPVNVVARNSVTTTSRKREVWEKGIKGQATILQRPKKNRMSPNGATDARWLIRVELPDRAPYELKSMQSLGLGAWNNMTEGSVVEARVDPKNLKRVLLLPPTQI